MAWEQICSDCQNYCTSLYNEIENYTFKITVTSPSSQWVNSLSYSDAIWQYAPWSWLVRVITWTNFDLGSWAIDPSHKSHNASDKYPIMHHFVTEMCTFVTKWCIVGYGAGALWDYAIDLFWRFFPLSPGVNELKWQLHLPGLNELNLHGRCFSLCNIQSTVNSLI